MPQPFPLALPQQILHNRNNLQSHLLLHKSILLNFQINNKNSHWARCLNHKLIYTKILHKMAVCNKHREFSNIYNLHKTEIQISSKTKLP